MEEKEAIRQREHAEREAREQQEREQQLNERVQREVQIQVENLKATQRQLTADPMEEWLLKGAPFILHDTKDRVPVFVRVNAAGVLSWKKRQKDKADGGDELGSLDLNDVSKIKAIPNPDAHDNVHSVNLISITVRFPSTDGTQQFEEFELDLEAESVKTHKDWLTALGYATRNIKEPQLGTLSRPEGDMARGNILAAEYMDRIISLIEQREMSDHLHTHEGHAAHAAMAGELEAGKRAAGGGGAMGGAIDVNHPVVQASSSLLLKERKRMESSTGKVEELQRALMELALKNAELEQELEKYRKMVGGGAGLAGTSSRPSIAGDEAKRLIADAEQHLRAAQTVVDERKHKIDTALKKVNDCEKAKKNTLATMAMLGIPLDASSAPEDATGQRLRKLLAEQTLALEQSKYGLDQEVAAMVNEEKDLTKRQSEYEEKIKSAKGEAPARAIGFRNVGKKIRCSDSDLGWWKSGAWRCASAAAG